MSWKDRVLGGWGEEAQPWGTPPVSWVLRAVRVFVDLLPAVISCLCPLCVKLPLFTWPVTSDPLGVYVFHILYPPVEHPFLL